MGLLTKVLLRLHKIDNYFLIELDQEIEKKTNEVVLLCNIC